MLRDATGADAAAIAALHVASWRDAYRGIFSDALLDGALAVEMAAKWPGQLAGLPEAGVVLVAERGGAALGFVAVWQRDDLAYIDNLHVAPDARGAGLGPALLAEAAARMRARGCTAAALHVFARNAGAIRFYGRLGALIGPEEPVEVFGETVVERRCDWPGIGALMAAARAAAQPA